MWHSYEGVALAQGLGWLKDFGQTLLLTASRTDYLLETKYVDALSFLIPYRTRDSVRVVFIAAVASSFSSRYTPFSGELSYLLRFLSHV